MNKNAIKSKTFWFGILSAVAPLFPSVQGFLVENMVMVTSLWSALVIVLRLVSKDKIKLLP